MNNRKLLGQMLSVMLLLGLSVGMMAATTLKPRIVVLTDIAPGDIEPDDMESMVRLMAYADQLEIEGIITSTGWNCDPYPTGWADSLQSVIRAYEHDVCQLMKRSSQKRFLPLSKEQGRQPIGYWPSPAYLRSRVAMGSQRSGIKVIGADNDSPGSQLIIQLVDEPDPRPLWIACWGGANTLAQAIWRVQQERSPEQLKTFLRKLRVYTITDQDMVYAMRRNRAYSSHQWLRREFADDLLFIWDESAWLMQCDLGKRNWQQYASQVQGKGRLGQVYPTFKWGVEGDTPSFLYVLPTGLHQPDVPAQIGWAGCFLRDLCPDSLTHAWTNWRAPQKAISDDYERQFYDDIFNDFAARMEWAASGKGLHNPVAIVNGKRGLEPIRLKGKAGRPITLDASKSYAVDGLPLSFRWWIQKDLSPFATQVTIEQQNGKAIVHLPATTQHEEVHVICEVRQESQPSLVSYRRIIIHL